LHTRVIAGWAGKLGSMRGQRLAHPGRAISGFSEFARFIDQRVTVIALINLDGVDVEAIANGVAALYLLPPQAAARLLRRMQEHESLALLLRTSHAVSVSWWTPRHETDNSS
jgi:hypothetical protein